MAKKKTAKKPGLTQKNLVLPIDWVEAIDKARGEETFSGWVRAALRAQLGDVALSEMPAWGQGRPKKRGKG